MNVKQLREKLNDVPDELEVVFWEGEWGYQPATEMLIKTGVIIRNDYERSEHKLYQAFVIQ